MCDEAAGFCWCAVLCSPNKTRLKDVSIAVVLPNGCSARWGWQCSGGGQAFPIL